MSIDQMNDVAIPQQETSGDVKQAAADKLNAATAAKYSKPNPDRGFISRFPRAILAVAAVSVVGTKKHEVPLDDVSYKTIPDAYGVYREAQARHSIHAAIEGPTDPEFNLLHDAHQAWDVLAKLEIMLLEVEQRYGREVMDKVINGKVTIKGFDDVGPTVHGASPDRTKEFYFCVPRSRL